MTQAVTRLTLAVEKISPPTPVKFIIMNTSGNQNKAAGETITTKEKMVIGLIRAILPPHVDNETAAAYLQTRFAMPYKSIAWVAVRPDDLIDEPSVTAYVTHPSPIRSAIFDAGKTSRINVAHFMSQLILDDVTWQKWQGQMPVIYNA